MTDFFFWLQVVLLIIGVTLLVIGLASSGSKEGQKDVYAGLLCVVVSIYLLLKDVVPENMKLLFSASTGVAMGLLLVLRVRQMRSRPLAQRGRVWQLASLIKAVFFSK